jgi:RHS repeat-associated protein
VKSVTYYDDYTWQTETAYNFQPANAFHTQGLTKGLVTGTLTRNLETNIWQKNVVYYDYKGRVIQDFHLTNRGNLIRKDYQYRFNGELLKTRITKGTSVKILTYEYDHVGRKTKFKHSLNGNEKTISKYVYDEIGRLKSKQFSPTSAIASLQTGNWTTTSTWQGGLLPTLSDNVSINAGHTITIPTGQTATAGSLYNAGTLQNYGTLNLGSLSGNATAGTLQTLDYKYHIRGGLLGINLDANNNLTNSLFSYKLTYEDDGTYYDGNIRNQYWKSTVDGIQRAYQYEYDGASRLKSAIYASTKSGETFALNSVSYDNNGNIKTLSRNGATNAAFTSFGNVDNLVYTYQNNSNKLLKVQDGISGNTDLGDFRDGTNTDNDYEYWEDGSLKRDKNKGISSIDYNYLKLPKLITFTDNRTIAYEYDAKGTKLKKTVSTGVVTEYEEDEIYVNGNPYQISHDEGRIANGIYEYNITDHLGNLRVAFKDSSGIAVATQSLFYDPWGLSMKGMQVSKNNSNFNKFQYNGKEIELEIGWSDYGARMYGAAEGRWWTQDLLAEASEDFTPYQYGANNPILNIDLLGLTDVNGDKKDDGTLLPEVVVRGKRNTSNLDNAQLALDIAGLYPGLSTIAGVANAGIDIYRGNYGSAGLNLLSAVPLLGTAMKGTKLAMMGAKAVSSVTKMKAIKSALAFTYRTLPSVTGMQKHHILPKALLGQFGTVFKKAGFNIHEGNNIMYLDKVFHGNHPEYTERVAERLAEIIQNNGTLTVGDIRSVISEFKQLVNEAATDWKKLGGPNLNGAFR